MVYLVLSATFWSSLSNGRLKPKKLKENWESCEFRHRVSISFLIDRNLWTGAKPRKSSRHCLVATIAGASYLVSSISHQKNFIFSLHRIANLAGHLNENKKQIAWSGQMRFKNLKIFFNKVYWPKSLFKRFGGSSDFTVRRQLLLCWFDYSAGNKFKQLNS